METRMDNHYICKFVNSKDIRKYLMDIDYQFSVPEYAYLIWQNREYSIAKKHEEFRRLIDNTESCIIQTSACREGWDLHQTIRDYIDLENDLIQKFQQPEDRSFYIGEWYELRDWFGGNCSFDSFDKAYDYAMSHADEKKHGSFRVLKRFIDNSINHSFEIEAIYNYDGEMTEIDFYGQPPDDSWGEDASELWAERFDDLWFDIPIPFKPGDIVYDCFNPDRTPFVITSTVPWYRKEHPPKSKGTLHLTNMDMTASGYSVDSDTVSVKYNWLSYPYMNLEYYNEDLDNEKRILTAYSLFKQKKINGDTLSKLVQMITAEYQANKYCHDIDWEIDNGTSKLLGIDKYKETSANGK